MANLSAWQTCLLATTCLPVYASSLFSTCSRKLFVSLSRAILLSDHLSVHICPFAFCLSVSLPDKPSFCMPVCLPGNPFSAYISVCLSVCLPGKPFLCLYVRLSVCLSAWHSFCLCRQMPCAEACTYPIFPAWVRLLGEGIRPYKGRPSLPIILIP